MKKLLAVVLLCICGMSLLLFYQMRLTVNERVQKQVAVVTESFKRENDRLLDFVKKLEKNQQEILDKRRESKELVDVKVDFKKWDCWCDLRSKLKQGGDYSVELKKFREIFSDNSDLLNLVNSLIRESDEGGSLNELTNNLLKFAKIRSVSESGLEKVSGYVLLLSIKGMKINE